MIIGVSFDPVKRARTRRERGLDFADAGEVFTGGIATVQDTRRDYGEDRYQTAGYIGDRLVVMVWTPRADRRYIVSMRYCHAKEADVWHRRMGGS